jgi:hypothetical protein
MVELAIGRVQKTKPYLFADAIELICAFDSQSPFSKTDAFTLLQEAVVSAEESLELDEPDLDDNNYDDNLGGVEITERVQGYIDECFRQFEYRQEEFGDDYPFEVTNEAINIKDGLSSRQNLYLAILATSRIRTFNRITGSKQKLADLFEILSAKALNNLLPDTATIVSFGPNSFDRKKKFGTNLRDAIPKLAKFMGLELTNGWDANLQPQGDARIDLVGVQELDQSEGGWNVFVAQCAAHEEPKTWNPKRIETRIDTYHYLFSYSVAWQPVLFIPGCFRQSNGKWADRRYVDSVILIDRVRLLRLIEADSDFDTKISKILNEALTVNE